MLISQHDIFTSTQVWVWGTFYDTGYTGQQNKSEYLAQWVLKDSWNTFTMVLIVFTQLFFLSFFQYFFQKMCWTLWFQGNANTEEAQTGANLLHESLCISLRPQQNKTLQLYLDTLRQILASFTNWAICHPYKAHAHTHTHNLLAGYRTGSALNALSRSECLPLLGFGPCLRRAKWNETLPHCCP